MGKSRAEIQRAYRERQKEKNKEEYLKKERQRKRSNYVPSNQLSEKERKERNKRNRANLRDFYARKKAERSRQTNEISNTSGYESNHEQTTPARCDNVERGRLVVRMNFGEESTGRRKSALQRWKRDRSLAHSRVRILEQERDKLRTKLKSTQRALQRLKRTTDTVTKEVELTPGKQTEREMVEANLNTKQKDKIRKSLLLSNVISNEIKQTKLITPTHKLRALHNIVAGKITKKYRCIKQLSMKTGLGRRQLGKVNSKIHQLQHVKRISKLNRYQESVITFMKREDNSRVQPGKNDAQRLQKGEKIQVQILTDYLKNLYLKFKSENPSINISFTTFCRSRPRYIYKTSMISRSSCLCLKHQNAALTVKTLRKYLENISANPETVSTNKPSKETLDDKIPDEVTVSQWTRVETEEKGKKKSMTRVVETKMTKDNFIKHFDNQMNDFKDHVERVHAQYEQIKLLKLRLPEHHMIVQLDFAENYSCRSHEEVQSAYFNQSSVTLHPMVAYWKTEDGTLTHKSFVTVSDEMAHKASTVLAFLDDLIPELKKIDKELHTVHYWSDSPSSQYRNRYIFDAVANHMRTYGCHARWNYFESGHGKGPCDGLGGTSKRMADEAARSGRHVICDASDFYKWGMSSSMKNVIFRFVSRDMCVAKAMKVSEREVKSVKGTMKLHAIVGQGHSKILTRNTSCYCDKCLSGDICNSWNEAHTFVETENSNTEQMEQMDPISEHLEIVDKEVPVARPVSIEEYHCDDYVAAIYQRAWYIGKIIDRDDEEVEIDFMERKKTYFQWPSRKDQIWISPSDILCQVPPPIATGKSNRMYMLDNDIILEIQTYFDRLNKK